MSKTVIIGGVAGGASCAARLRRLDESAEIVILERGDYISYANCGLPYYIGDVLRSRHSLLLQTPEAMKEKYNIDVRVDNEVISIDRDNKIVSVRRIQSGETYEESYDTLVIATGSSPIRPPIPGIGSPRIETLWTIPDADRIKSIVDNGGVKSAAIIGGGFIGLEMAENLNRLGLEVSIVEALDQVMAPLDYEMAQILHENIKSNNISLYLGDGVDSFSDDGKSVKIDLKSDKELAADIVVLSVGIRPDSSLAKEAGIGINDRGGIVTDEYLRTSDPHIYAVGDVIEVGDFIFGGRTMIPLAGPANKQGRIAADNIAGGNEKYNGTQGTSVAQIFDMTAASTGANEKNLVLRGMKKGRDYETIIINQHAHAAYYPGSASLTIKLIFSMDGKKIYGAQIVGKDGVDKRIDTISVTVRQGGGVGDLAELELAYSPPFSSAKDPVNIAGYAAANVISGKIEFAEWDFIEKNPEAVVLDVRESAELKAYSLPGAVHIPFGQLRDRLDELDKDKTIVSMCASGFRAYNAARILMNNGFEKVLLYPAGIHFYKSTHFDPQS